MRENVRRKWLEKRNLNKLRFESVNLSISSRKSKEGPNGWTISEISWTFDLNTHQHYICGGVISNNQLWKLSKRTFVEQKKIEEVSIATLNEEC